jgi:hypothetical protein
MMAILRKFSMDMEIPKITAQGEKAAIIREFAGTATDLFA